MVCNPAQGPKTPFSGLYGHSRPYSGRGWRLAGGRRAGKFFNHFHVVARVGAGDGDGGGAEPGGAAVCGIEDFGVEAVLAGPCEVHGQEHLGPVLGLGTSGSGGDGDEGCALVRVRALAGGLRSGLVVGPHFGGERQPQGLVGYFIFESWVAGYFGLGQCGEFFQVVGLVCEVKGFLWPGPVPFGLWRCRRWLP